MSSGRSRMYYCYIGSGSVWQTKTNPRTFNVLIDAGNSITKGSHPWGKNITLICLTHKTYKLENSGLIIKALIVITITDILCETHVREGGNAKKKYLFLYPTWEIMWLMLPKLLSRKTIFIVCKFHLFTSFKVPFALWFASFRLI